MGHFILKRPTAVQAGIPAYTVEVTIILNMLQKWNCDSTYPKKQIGKGLLNSILKQAKLLKQARGCPMSKRQLTVKVSSVEETLARFKDVWERAERDEKIEGAPLETVSFENAKLLMKTL